VCAPTLPDRWTPPASDHPRSCMRSLSLSHSRCSVGQACRRRAPLARSPPISLPSGTAPSAPMRACAYPLSLARGPCPSDPPSSSATVVPIACALPAIPVPTSARPAHVARALGKDPAHSLSSPLPHIRASPPSHSPSRGVASPRCRFAVPPSPLDFCQRFGHGELRLSLAH
jgi:hypothetical protein